MRGGGDTRKCKARCKCFSPSSTASQSEGANHMLVSAGRNNNKRVSICDKWCTRREVPKSGRGRRERWKAARYGKIRGAECRHGALQILFWLPCPKSSQLMSLWTGLFCDCWCSLPRARSAFACSQSE